MPLQIAHDVLVADATVTSLVGDKVHPKLAPQGTSYPYVILRVATTDPVTALDGWAGLDRNEITVDAYALEEAQAEFVANACRSALEAAGHLCRGRSGDDFDFQTDATAFRVGFVHQVWSP
jgi:hypothetical protein